MDRLAGEPWLPQLDVLREIAGPPPDGGAPVIAVGLRPGVVARHLRGCHTVARIANSDDVDNAERGRAVLVCEGPRRPWSKAWQSLRHLG